MNNFCPICGEPLEALPFCYDCKADRADSDHSAKLDFARMNKAAALTEYIGAMDERELCELYDELAEYSDFEYDAAELYADALYRDYIDYYVWERQ